MPSLHSHSTHWESHLHQPGECPWLQLSGWNRTPETSWVTRVLSSRSLERSLRGSLLWMLLDSSFQSGEKVSFGWRCREWGNQETEKTEAVTREQSPWWRKIQGAAMLPTPAYGFLKNPSPVLLCFKEACLITFPLSPNSTLGLKQSLREDFLKTLGEPTDSLERHSGWTKTGSCSQTCMSANALHQLLIDGLWEWKAACESSFTCLTWPAWPGKRLQWPMHSWVSLPQTCSGNHRTPVFFGSSGCTEPSQWILEFISAPGLQWMMAFATRKMLSVLWSPISSQNCKDWSTELSTESPLVKI